MAGGAPVGIVLTQPDRPAGRRRRPTPPPVALAARDLGLEVLQPERADEATPALAARGVRVGAVCAYGQILGPGLLGAVEWLNLHPSALPRWRGAAPVERAIMAGDAATAVCVMRVVAALDAGTVMARALALGTPLLVDALRRSLAGGLTTVPQAPAGVTYAPKLGRDDRLVDPAGTVRVEVDRIRALRPHIGALLRLGGHDVVVWRARAAGDGARHGAVEVAGGRLVVGLADGALELLEVQAPGRRPLDAAAYLRGVRHALGPAVRAS